MRYELIYQNDNEVFNNELIYDGICQSIVKKMRETVKTAIEYVA